MKHSVIHSDVTETLKLIALRLHNLSIKQADGAMGYLGIMLIMRYHDDGGTLMVQLGKQMHHLGTILGIEVTRRLIGQDELRTKDHGTGDGYSLLLTTRKLVREVLGTMTEQRRCSSPSSLPSHQVRASASPSPARC